MIRIRNLTKRYTDKIIFTNFSFHFEVGKMYAIVGSSGCGKTTLLKIILGEDKNYAGKVVFSKKHTRKDISYAEQFPDFFEALTGKEHFKLIKRNTVINKRKYNVNLNQKVLTLSGGERKKLSLELAILKPHTILLLDEPTASIDEVNKLRVMETLSLIKSKRTIIFSTHDLDLAHTFADEVIRL